MPIDLSKPIRRKRDKEEVTYIGPMEAQLYDPHVGRFYITDEELERNYENIPEPRKPRQWTILVCDSNTGDCNFFGPSDTESFSDPQRRVRVIEWPEGAPLPDWPE